MCRCYCAAKSYIKHLTFSLLVLPPDTKSHSGVRIRHVFVAVVTEELRLEFWQNSANVARNI